MSTPFPGKRIFLILSAAVFIFLMWSMTAPSDFPPKYIITVPEGKGLQHISKDLEEEHLIRSPFWFRTFAIILGGERTMQAGEYYFAAPESAPVIAWRISRGDHQIERVKLTLPEGLTVLQVSERFDTRFPFFDHGVFEATAREGYLFPDTYFVPVTATASSTIKFMEENFNKQVVPFLPAVKLSGKTLNQIVTMASLLEAEAKTELDRQMVSDILWKRLKLGMPLQVDSEMGTYEFPGLPANPINNPGLISIKAALYPLKTPYLYFLTGKDGKMHYAKTFDEHKQNILRYLGK